MAYKAIMWNDEDEDFQLDFKEAQSLLEVFWMISQRSFMLCSEIKKYIHDQKLSTRREVLEAIFNNIDKDQDGFLSFKELYSFFEEMHRSWYLAFNT